jgi:hypothetical protein
MMHGIFFGNINCAADSGLYAGLVQNRSFEHRDHFFAWSNLSRGGDGAVTVELGEPLNATNTNYARIEVRTAGQGFGIANTGYDWIAVKGARTVSFPSIRDKSQQCKNDL